jgi:putative oxygen-independent coproporphyrinogen III oxidase
MRFRQLHEPTADSLVTRLRSHNQPVDASTGGAILESQWPRENYADELSPLDCQPELEVGVFEGADSYRRQLALGPQERPHSPDFAFAASPVIDHAPCYTRYVTQPLSLYVHIPFCSAKCTYCDFNSYAGQDRLMAPYAVAVAREAGLWATYIDSRPVETVFFGGGTPSLLPLEHMRTIVDALRERFEINAGAEASLEANPGTIDLAHLEGLLGLGFNRISFGVQSFHDEELRQLDRIHDAREVTEAYRWARQAGFENVNLDLIYGLIGQSMAAWQTNLETALALGPDHLSLYALTIEEGTPLAREIAHGRSPGPDLDLQADMFEWTRERMAKAGYDQYEVSNWARSGRQCRHNLVYWHNGDWLGLGAGAHSHLFDERFADAASPLRYIDLVEQGTRNMEHGSESDHVPDFPQITFREPADRAREMSETVILALRLREGLDIAAFERRFGVSFTDVFGGPLEETVALGLTEVVSGYLRLRDEAVLLGDEAFLRFLP